MERTHEVGGIRSPPTDAEGCGPPDAELGPQLFGERDSMTHSGMLASTTLSRRGVRAPVPDQVDNPPAHLFVQSDSPGF
ncbi:hypothetical protein GCM10009651_27820 [Microbacterium natoriense]